MLGSARVCRGNRPLLLAAGGRAGFREAPRTTACARRGGSVVAARALVPGRLYQAGKLLTSGAGARRERGRATPTTCAATTNTTAKSARSKSKDKLKREQARNSKKRGSGGGNGAPPTERGTTMTGFEMRLERGRAVTRSGAVVLEDVTPEAIVSPEPIEAGKGLLLSLETETDTHAADFKLAQLKCTRFLACARNKLWWMTPEWGSEAKDLPPETQFLLVELEDGTYATILPLLDSGFRGTLRPPRRGDGTSTLMLRIESGDIAVRNRSWRSALFLASGPDPFELVESSVASAAALSGGGRPLKDKQLPAMIDHFGWCTWDAFYSRVSAQGIAQGLTSLHDIDVPPGFLIIDDGWQQTDVDAEFRLPPTQRAVEDAAEIVKKTVHTDSVDATIDRLQRSVGQTGEEYMVAETEVLARAARKLPGGTSAGNVMPSLAGEGPRHKSLHHSAKGAHELVTRDGDEADAASTPEEEVENAIVRAWGAAVNKLAGWLAGAGSAAFLKFYQYVIEPSAPDSMATRLFGSACRGFLRTTMLGFYADASDFTRRLTSVRANAKFSSPDAHPDLEWDEAEEDLHGVVTSLRERFGVKFVYCWHGLPAYWSGLMPPPPPEGNGAHQAPEMAKYDVRLEFGRPSDSLLEIEPSLAWNPSVLAGIGVLADPAPLYKDMHTYLASAGIDGVKVDCQAGVGLVGSTMGGGPSCARVYHSALEASIQDNFPGNHCINCMSHSTENLYHYTGTAIARASDDFYPRDPDSCTPHIAACAYNSVFMSPLVQPDWDMFHSKHPDAVLHATARAVSGGAVYVSDKPGQHDPALLRSLVLADGSILRCRQPARPTRDSLMRDPLRDGKSALKVWNVNAVTGVVAVFNLQGASWDRSKRKFHTHNAQPPTLSAQVKPADVEALNQLGPSGDGEPSGEYAVHMRSRGEVSVLSSSTSTIDVTVPAQTAEIFAVVPIQAAGGVRFAPLGCPDEMINGGGAVRNWQCCATPSSSNGAAPRVSHSVRVRCAAPLLAHCSASPCEVRVDGTAVDYAFNAAQQTLRVPLPAAEDGKKVAEREVVVEFA